LEDDDDDDDDGDGDGDGDGFDDDARQSRRIDGVLFRPSLFIRQFCGAFASTATVPLTKN
jgi:hypothetical protein